MLTKPEDYQYIKPIAKGIKGEILPVVDGTPKLYVAAYEDICYLIEMFLERNFWGMAYKNPNLVSYYYPEDVTCSKHNISRLFEHIDRYLDYGGVNGPVPTDWEEPEYPIVSDGATSDVVKWRSSMVKSRRFKYPVDISQLLEVDSLRLLYYELGNSKRWRLPESDVSRLTEESFALWDESMISMISGVILSVQQGGYKYYFWKEDGTVSITEVTNKARYPSMAFGESLGVYKVAYFSTFRFWIKAGFLVNPKTKELYYTESKIYPQISISIYYELNGRSINTTRNAILSPTSGKYTVTDEKKGCDGYFTIGVNDPLHPWFLAGYRIAEEIVSREFPGGKLTSCEIGLRAVTIVTGEVKHNADLPETWDWEPPKDAPNNA